MLPGDTPQTILREYRHGELKSFDPSMLQRFEVNALGSWVVIASEPPWDNSERVLTIYPLPLSAVAVYGQDQSAMLASADFSAALHGHGRLAWRVPPDQAASVPIVLKFEPATMPGSPVRFEMQPLNAYLQQDAQWLAFASASFAVMLAIVLMALCFALMLSDIAFVWYAGFILCYLFIQGMQTGFLFHPLDWQWLSDQRVTSGAIAVALSVIFASLFMIRFCELRLHAPLFRVPVMAVAVSMGLLVMMHCSHIGLLMSTAEILLNPLLMLGAALLLLSAIVAGMHGSRRAWFFLLGWTPLLVLTGMTGVQQSNGALPGLDWLNDASLGAGAFETIVLSLGLADRTLRLRRDRDFVRSLANHDALTNVLNRRAWSERANTLLDLDIPQPVAMLFLDLDNFKQLNDCQGHNAGDRALVEVSKALGEDLRSTHLLGRYGGEEFVVLLDGVTEEQAMRVATRLCRRVHRLDIRINDELILSTSIGVAMRREGDNVESLAKRADQAMYTAKLGGGNQVCLYRDGQPVPAAAHSRLRIVKNDPTR